MAYKSHLTARVSSKGAGGGKANKGTVYGRVVRSILTLSDPDCKDSSMLNGVFYRIPKTPGDETNDSGVDNTILFAKQGDASMRVIPMPGELVEIVPALGVNATGGKVMYWGRIINVWNHPHHNAVPDIKQQDWKDRLIGGQPEEATISPLQANPGDTLFEGRLGQSLRFGGYKGAQSKLIDGSNDGKPIILISNGQAKTDEGNTPIEEDINQDYNSMHLLSNHKSDLTASNTKRDSYNTIPPASNEFKGNQIILNGGRIYLNAKEDSILLSAKESVGLNAKTVNLDATDYFCVDSKKIYLGMQLDNWLQSLISNLQLIAGAMKSATNGGGAVASLQAAGTALDTTLRSLQTQIQNIKSKKVYIE